MQRRHLLPFATSLCGLAIAVVSGCGPAGPHQLGPDTVRIDDRSFQSLVLDSPLPVLVDFSATWCGPCQQMAPTIDELATTYKGRAVVGQVDVDDSPNVSAQYGIESIPCLILFQNGEESGRLTGLSSRSEIRALLDSAKKPAPAAQ